MTLLVFLGVVLSLLIFRELPGLAMRLIAAIPRRHLFAMTAWLGRRRVAIVFARGNATPPNPRHRLRLVLVSSTLLVLALVATTEYWSTHSGMLMAFLR